MVTLKENLIQVHNYVIDRIHTLCEDDIDDAYSIHCEFREWMNPNVKDCLLYTSPSPRDRG